MKISRITVHNYTVAYEDDFETGATTMVYTLECVLIQNVS